MKISLIIPVLNEAQGLPCLLERLLPLRRHGLEILIVDGGSDDGSAAIAECAGFSVLRSARGRARQMNAGATAATGDVLLFLHADTGLPEGVQQLIGAALADGRHVWGRFDVHIRGQAFMLRVVAALMNLRSRWSGIATGDQAMFMTRQAFEAVGGFPEQPLMEDIELSRRLSQLSRRVYRATSHNLGTVLGDTRNLAHNLFDVASALGLLARRIHKRTGAGLPMKKIRIVIFAKAPLPGFAKTRLIPALGAEGAARLAKRMLETTVAQALAANIGPVELCITPAVDDPVWKSISLPPGIDYSFQGEGDLGARMLRAAERVIMQGESVLLIGTDSPNLNASRLRDAAALLHEADAAIFSSADGGYILLGLNRFHPLLFRGIPWSTDTVAFATLCRIGQLGWSVRNGPMLHDIDESDDLKWLPAEWQEVLYAQADENADSNGHETRSLRTL